MESNPGEAVKTLRTELGVSQTWLAQQVGVSQQTIARWEGGGEIPTKYLRDLAVALGTTVADLVSGGEPQSYLARMVDRREGRFDKEPDPELLFGTLRLRWLPSVRELLNPQPETEHQWPKPFTREYAISNGERRRISIRLDDRGERSGNWFSFNSLDNRLVFVNRSQLESLELAGLEIEEEPPTYENEEIYRALEDPALRDALVSEQPFESFGGEDAPFSATTIQRCLDLAERVGFDRLLESIDYAYAQTIDGREIELVPHPSDETLSELNLLEIQLDRIWPKDEGPVDDWLVELEEEGWQRSVLHRLGSLRVIEVPLLKYHDYWRRAWEESESTTTDDQEEQDG